MQAQIEDGLRLRLGHFIGAVCRACEAFIDEQDKRRDVFRGPGAVHQFLPRNGGVIRLADKRDHFIDIGDGDGEAEQDMGAVARLLEFEFRAARDGLFAEIDEGRENLLEIHQLRAAAVEREHVDGEIRLQWRMRKKLVEHDIGHRVALELDHHAHAVAVGIVAQIADAFDDLFIARIRRCVRQASPCSPDTGISVKMIAWRSLRISSNAVRARMVMLPRPV